MPPRSDDLSPAPDAWSRPDIPLHAKAMFKIERDGIHDNEAQIKAMQEETGVPLACVLPRPGDPFHSTLDCATRGSRQRRPWSRALSNSAVDRRVLWNQLPELVKD